MIIQLFLNQKKYSANLSEPLDISLPLKEGNDNPNCYWAEPATIETIVSGGFIGSVKQGGSVNHQKITITPHGNGTHTECYGHISSEDNAFLTRNLKQFHFLAELISVAPEKHVNGDFIITANSIKQKINHKNIEALIIRTLPNEDTKRNYKYSGTNPPYLEEWGAGYIADYGVKHLLIDLPSIDREEDAGRLSAHRKFWNFPEDIRKDCTITELIYAADSIPDGLYLLNLQITSLEMDASPSKPVLYKLREVL